MLPVSPVIALMKVPIPVPSVVWLLAIVGLLEVLQQTPLALIVEPPSDEILPPEVAVVMVMAVAAVVVKFTAPGVNVISLPFDVPALLTPTILK